MRQIREAGRDPVEDAVALARDVAPDLDAVLFTHFPDADTLDVFRPGETDLATAAAVNRAVAAELAGAGVEIIVQQADRGAFRRWMEARDDTPAERRRWIDRANLLRGPAAHRLLGIDPAAPPRPPTFGKAPGPVADRVLAAFAEEESGEFDDLVRSLLIAGREDVLDLALRKMLQSGGDEAASELEGEMLALAEAASLGPSGWASLVALPVALQVDVLPDAVALGESLVRAGVLPDHADIRFLPGWRDPEALDELRPMALRRVLLDLLAGKEPRDLPPGDTDDLQQRGFGVLLGLEIDWSIPIWDEIALQGGLPEDEDAEAREEAGRAALFDRWRAAVYETSGRCVPLALVPPSETAAEIADFLEEADSQAGGIDEIRDFVAVARQEAGTDDIVCRVEILGDGLELSIYTERGRFLDSLSLPAERLPARPEEMRSLIAAFVRVVKDTPGH